MMELSYRRHRFPPVVIQRAVWLYLRFTLSYRDVEDLLAERGLNISYETVRSWVLKFGPVIVRRLRRRRPRPSDRWHLDEMVVRIAGKRMYLWRAVGSSLPPCIRKAWVDWPRIRSRRRVSTASPPAWAVPRRSALWQLFIWRATAGWKMKAKRRVSTASPPTKA